MEAERISDALVYHGEGPCWWPATGALRYVDMLAGDVMTWHPDGLCVDAEGGIWVALNGGGAVHRYDPDGARTATIEVGARQSTACTFGGPDLSTLFITTSREGLDEGEDPTAGSLYAVSPGVRGLPPLAFGR